MIKFMLNNIKSGLVVLGLFLMVGVLTLTSAFKSKPANSKDNNKLVVTWYYNSNSSASGDIIDGTKWTTSNPGLSGCVSSTTPPLPCSLNVPDNVTTSAQLDAYFTSQYSDNATTIKNAANSRREIPD
jgi:hypothetical protein